MPIPIPLKHEACGAQICRAKVLPLLYQMHQLISSSQDLSQTLNVILQIMERQMRVVRGMVNLFNSRTGKIFIHEALGLSPEEEARGIYDLGEGITGKVVEQGQTIVVSRVSDEPAFLNRTGSRQVVADRELSFICVPIMRGKKVLGTISAERIYDSPGLLEQDVELLTIISGMVAQEVELYLLLHQEKPLLEQENRRLQDALKEKFRPSNILGSSKPMRDVYSLIEKIAPTKTTVLILGESGVGKELVASAIHYHSQGSSGPFIRFNCAALPETLIESELFGHEKGAFTGAVALRKGHFESSSGGTIFLDEVGELSLAIQAKLLRVLQEKIIQRVGSSVPVKVDIRILTATNRDLGQMVKDGTFREDLYYRLNVFPLLIPPLRERGSDIITLADHFVKKFSEASGKAVKRISTPAIDMLSSYHWPGNVRELENVVERAVILSDDEVIHGYNLPPSLQTGSYSGTVTLGNLEKKLQTVEFELLVEALKESGGNVTKAGELLGLTKRMMGIRLEKYDLDYTKFRKGRL